MRDVQQCDQFVSSMIVIPHVSYHSTYVTYTNIPLQDYRIRIDKILKYAQYTLISGAAHMTADLYITTGSMMRPYRILKLSKIRMLVSLF
jgi:hypothetical protein